MHNKLFILIQTVFVHLFSTYPTWYIETNHTKVASTQLCQQAPRGWRGALNLETRPRQQQTPIATLSFFGQMDCFELCLVAYFFF